MARAPVMAVVLGLLLAGAGRTQPGELPERWNPGEVFELSRRVYRSAPLAEEIAVTVTPPGGAPSTDRLVLRMDAERAAAEDGPRSILLELGALRVHIGGGRLIATHTREPGVYFEAPFERSISASSLLDVLPPVPVPQLALVIPGDKEMRTPTPFTKGVRWLTALSEGDERTAVITVHGRGFDGPVTMTVDVATSRVARFSAEFPGEGGPGRLDLTCRPVSPGDPAEWVPDIAGRRRVATLAELRAAGERPVLRPGDPVPDIMLIGADQSAWSLHRAAREEAVGPGGVCLVLFRVPADPLRAAELESAARAGRDALREARAGADAGSDRAAAVIGLADFSREGFSALRERWGAGGAKGSADDLAWASSPGATIERFAPDAGAILVVVRPDLTLGGVIRLDGRDTEGLGADLRGMLRSP